MTQTNKLAEARLTIEHINKFLHVNTETGILTWKKISAEDIPSKSQLAADKRNGRFAGKQAGSVCSVNGYVNVHLIDRLYRVHRIIWFFEHGYWPEYIDHVNRDRSDNRIANLRNVSHSDNHKNTPMRVNNKTGVNGVVFCKKSGKYRAEIQSKGVRYNLGTFDTLELAAKARSDAEKEFGFHKNHGKGSAMYSQA